MSRTPTLDEFYAITTRRLRDYICALPLKNADPNANPLAIDFWTKTLVCILWSLRVFAWFGFLRLSSNGFCP